MVGNDAMNHRRKRPRRRDSWKKRNRWRRYDSNSKRVREAIKGGDA